MPRPPNCLFNTPLVTGGIREDMDICHDLPLLQMTECKESKFLIDRAFLYMQHALWITSVMPLFARRRRIGVLSSLGSHTGMIMPHTRGLCKGWRVSSLTLPFPQCRNGAVFSDIQVTYRCDSRGRGEDRRKHLCGGPVSPLAGGGQANNCRFQSPRMNNCKAPHDVFWTCQLPWSELCLLPQILMLKS